MIETIPKFITLTDISESPDNPLFEIYSDVDIKYSFRGKVYQVTIPKGFTTDMGSVPKAFRSWISNVCVFDRAFILHDYFYSKLCEINISRQDADIILRRSLEFLGMNFFDRWSVYYAVRIGGSKRFRKTK